MRQILFCTSPIGLGHASRDVAVAKRLATMGFDITFLTAYPASRLLADYGFRVLDVYPRYGFRTVDGELKSSTLWLIGYWRFYKKCRAIARSLLRKLSPQLIVSDEDFASVSEAHSMGIRAVMLTDLLYTNFAKNPLTRFMEVRMNRSMRDILNKCRLVIVPDHGRDDSNFRFLGPIVRETDRSRDELIRMFNFSKKTILGTFGGTSAGMLLHQRLLLAYESMGGGNLSLVVVSEIPVPNKFASNVREFKYYRDLHEMIYAADMVVSLAGHSTMDECEAYGTPGVFIPIGNHFEQEENAKRRGFSFKDMNRLQELIELKLGEPRGLLHPSGATKAAEAIALELKR